MIQPNVLRVVLFSLNEKHGSAQSVEKMFVILVTTFNFAKDAERVLSVLIVRVLYTCLFYDTPKT
jgi:hypothetical protein